MSASLVGSEMCIRDRDSDGSEDSDPPGSEAMRALEARSASCTSRTLAWRCLLYTSDAADDM
eukprot:10688570-Alexandrium_andersonii.AAC.1